MTSLAAFPTLAQVLQVHHLQENHFLAKCVRDRQGAHILDWLSNRYTFVFRCPRIEWRGNRRDELLCMLKNPRLFDAADAEVQTMATLLASSKTNFAAQAEGDERGERRADLLLLKPAKVDVEIRRLQEQAQRRKRAALASSIEQRLGTHLATAKPLTAVVRVGRTHDKYGKLLLDQSGEKRLAQAVIRAVNGSSRLTSAVHIVLEADGSTRQHDGRSISRSALADVELRPSAASLRLTYSGLHPVTGAAEACRAVKKKRDRRQRAGTRPFVVVLDHTHAPFMSETEIEAGVGEVFATATSISAIVVQLRRLTTVEPPFSPNSRWSVSFSSKVVLNARARHPLSDELVELFSVAGT